MATIAAQVLPTGIVSPDYANILQQIRILYWSIYGSDADLGDDTQDGQFLGILAQLLYDNNQMAVAIYNAFSPSTAQGVGLSSVVKNNGLRRLVPTNSQVPVVIVGQVGTQILNGQIGDDLNLGTTWNLPAVVDIPVGGTVTVTATAANVGSVAAAPDTLTVMLTPTRGWQTVTNPDAATTGEPVESDAELRLRQSRSVALPALTILESIYAAVAAVQGVGRLAVLENDDDVPDADGIPAHNICVIVSGGDVTQVAGAIASKKAPGPGTFGTTEVVVVDQKGVPNTIRFFELTAVPITIEIDITALSGYVSTTGDLIINNDVAFVNALDIGEDSYLSRLYSPTNLGGIGLGATFVVTAIRQSRDAGPPTAANVVIAFNEAATCVAANVTLNVT